MNRVVPLDHPSLTNDHNRKNFTGKLKLGKYSDTIDVDWIFPKNLSEDDPLREVAWAYPRKYNLCMRCEKIFIFNRWPHHCRACGVMICRSCTAYAKVKNRDTGKDTGKEVRVCSACMDQTLKDSKCDVGDKKIDCQLTSNSVFIQKSGQYIVSLTKRIPHTAPQRFCVRRFNVRYHMNYSNSLFKLSSFRANRRDQCQGIQKEFSLSSKRLISIKQSNYFPSLNSKNLIRYQLLSTLEGN